MADAEVHGGRFAAASEGAPLEVPLMHAPTLTWLAVGAIGVEAIMNRLALRAWGADLPHATRVLLDRLGALPRNLAAVAGLTAIGLGLFSFVRARGAVTLPGRIGLAAFAGIVLPILTLATVLPGARTTPPIVLLATGAANVLATFLAVSVIGRRGPAHLRLAMAAFALSALLGFAATVLMIASALLSLPAASVLARTMAVAGETVWVLFPLVFAPSLMPRADGAGRVRPWMAAAVASFGTLCLLLWARLTLRSHFGAVLYGLTHLSALADIAPLAYTPLVAAAVGVATLGVASPEPAKRQLGAGLLSLAAAGFKPSAPILLLELTLGAVLLTRACLALGTLELARRTLAAFDGEP